MSVITLQQQSIATAVRLSMQLTPCSLLAKDREDAVARTQGLGMVCLHLYYAKEHANILLDARRRTHAHFRQGLCHLVQESCVIELREATQPA